MVPLKGGVLIGSGLGGMLTGDGVGAGDSPCPHEKRGNRIRRVKILL